MGSIGTSTRLRNLSPENVEIKNLESEIVYLREQKMLTNDNHEKSLIQNRIRARRRKIQKLKNALGFATKTVASLSRGSQIMNDGNGLYVNDCQRFYSKKARRWVVRYTQRALTAEEHKLYKEGKLK